MNDPLLLRCLLVIVRMCLGHSPGAFRDGLLLEKELAAKLAVETPLEPVVEPATET